MNYLSHQEIWMCHRHIAKSCSEFPILIPLIALLSLILSAKNSAHIMKMYGERGSPLRQPQPIWKKDDK